MKEKLVLIIKGFIIGGTMLVPGVSGGSMAIILGIYGDLISSVSNFFYNKRKHFAFLFIFSLGALLGMLLFSKSILTLLDNYRMPVLYFFIGAVFGGIPTITKTCGLKRLNMSSVAYILTGVILVLSLTLIPEGLFNPTSIESFQGSIMLLAAGFFAAIALILPGISVSFVLLVLGIYEEIINAITNFNIPYLTIIFIGLVLGIVTTTKLLEKAMNNYKTATYLIILGFVLGSVLPIFPGAPTGINILICPISLFLGVGFVRLLSLLDR